jgi:hypothetical protein
LPHQTVRNLIISSVLLFIIGFVSALFVYSS